MSTSDAPIAIAGAGLAGALFASLLAQRGEEVRIYERRPDLRRVEGDAGRSINLALSVRGLTALERAGVRDAVMAHALPMRGRMMHAEDGGLTFQPYGRRDEAIYSVSRRRLNELLLDRAEALGVSVAFETRVRDVDVRDGTLTLESGSGERWRAPSRFVVGADGAFSQVRQRLQRRGRFDFSQRYLPHGYKELEMPPADDGGFRLAPDALHIWPRRDFMLIALPNPNRTFTCTLFLRHDATDASGGPSFEALRAPGAARALFESAFPDALPHLPDLEAQFSANPVGNLLTIRCAPFHNGAHAVLIGDAAHAMVPFYGQGMNAAFEDCRLLDEALATSPTDAARAATFAAYSRQRKPDADAIADLALHNFVVMRDSVRDDGFLARKALERLLETAFPETYRALYGLVSFSNTPYAESVRLAAARSAWLDARIDDATSAPTDPELLGLLALAWTRQWATECDAD